MTKYIYVVHSDIDENNLYAEFETEVEAIEYAKDHSEDLTYVDKVEVALDDEGEISEFLESETIWIYDTEESIAESINFKNKAEQDEFFNLCKECGFVTLKDLENFKVNAGVEDADLIQALRDYRDSLNAFDVFDDEVECQSCGTVTRGLRTDGGYHVCKNCVEESIDDLVEKLEENEDMVECKECFELFPKQDGFKIEVGYLCPHCQEVKFTVADEDTFKVDFPEYERMTVADDFVDYHTAETSAPSTPAESEPVGPEGESGMPSDDVETALDFLVKDEEEAVAGYEQVAEVVKNSEVENKEEILDTIDHIKEEEQEHIEELEELVVTEDKVEDEEVEENENDSISTTEEETKEPLTESKWKVSKESFKEEMEGQEGVQVAYGDPYEFGILVRDWYASDLGNGRYELYANDLTVNEDEYEYVDSIEFDSFDEFWEYLTETLVANGDYSLEFEVIGGEELVEHVNEEHPAIESDQELAGTDNAVADCKVNKVITHSEDEKPVDCEGKKKPLEKPLTESKCQDCGGELENNKCTSCDRNYNLPKCQKCGGEVVDGKCTSCDELQEETHAQFAKPEGNRIQAFNNALKYAKRDNADYIYGYTNHTGKFFALEQPIKVKGDISTVEKEFRNQYKNCKVVYVAYPDKAFLKESLYNFTPEEMEEYGIDEEGYPVDGWDTYVRCNWCKEVFTEYDCVFEANLGWLCPRCQDEVRSHGGPLTIMEYPSEEDIRRTLEEATKMTRDELMAKEGTDDVELINAGRPEEERVELVEDSRKEKPDEEVEEANTASLEGMDFEEACKQFGIEIED